MSRVDLAAMERDHRGDAEFVAGGSGGACSGDGCGTVFKLTHSGKVWSESVLYNFAGDRDGSGPGGGVVFDHSGNLYGTTPDGGDVNGCACGVVYELSPAKSGKWKQTVIHTFTGGNDGSCSLRFRFN